MVWSRTRKPVNTKANMSTTIQAWVRPQLPPKYENTKYKVYQNNKTKHLNKAVVPTLETSCVFNMLLQPMKRI